MSLMPSPSIWNSGAFGSVDPTLAARVTNLEGKYVRTTRFAIISSGTSGTITKPANSTIILDDFGGTVDAVVSTASGGRPTYASALTSGNVPVGTTFDSSGNYTLSAAPSAYPIAIVYRVQQALKDFDPTSSDIVGPPQVVDQTGIFVRKTGDTMTGQLVLPSWHINGVGFPSTLDAYYDPGTDGFRFDSLSSLITVSNTTTNSRLEIDAAGSASLIGGTYGNAISAGGGGEISIVGTNLGALTIRSDFNQDIHFGNSGDYKIFNDVYAEVFQALGTGEMLFNSYNSNDITFTSSRDTYFLTNNHGNLITSQQIWLQDPSGSAVQAIIQVKSDGNFAIGMGNFSAIDSAATRNIALGVDSMAGYQNGTDNIGIGYRSLHGLSGSMAGSANIGIGTQTLENLTSGSGNFAAGDHALNSVTQGSSNFGFGTQVLSSITIGDNNFAAGAQAGVNTTDGNSNVFIGSGAGQFNVNGSSNVYLGESAGAFQLGSGNIAIGNGSLTGAMGATSTATIAIGQNSFPNITSGSNNTLISSNGGGTVTSASRVIIIGADCDVPSATANGQMSIGNFIYGKGLTATGSTVSPANIGYGVKDPTARLHLVQGSTAANNAPLKFNNGSNMTTPEAGAMEWDGANLFITQTTGPTRQTIAYVSTTPLQLKDFFTNGGNTTTTETDLYTYTTAASQLSVNGQKIDAEYGGLFVSSATATRQVRIYFAGTLIFDTGALTLSLSSAWTTYVTLIRVSSTVIRYQISFTTEGAALAAYTAVGELTGLTLSNTNILKITGQSAGVGAATNDIVAKMGNISWRPAA